MSTTLSKVLENNRRWSENITQKNPEFFATLSKQQHPEILWIGCADSRVPANQIVDMLPGELFVHRNVSNLVVHSDLNCLSVIQFAVDVLKVKHIMVCGHLCCGGIRASYFRQKLGLIDNWLRHVQDIRTAHDKFLESIPEVEDRIDALCALNVIEQANNVSETTIVQGAWERGQPLAVHGLIYSLQDGRLRDLNTTIEAQDQVEAQYRSSVEILQAQYRSR